MNNETVKRPPLTYFLTELIRGAWDRLGSWSYRRSFPSTESADPHPVLVIPGLLSDDASTKPLRSVLEKMGHHVYGWEQGRNLAQLSDVESLEQHLVNIFERHQAKVSIIGWSLGGLYARKIAADQLEMTRQIITLGSPYQDIHAPSWASYTVKFLWRTKEIEIPTAHQGWINGLAAARQVATTSIYSKQDGIVPWSCCIEEVEDELHQNIEVSSSHTSMIANLDVLKICVDRVNSDIADWAPYRKA